jgi:hypothetical protein
VAIEKETRTFWVRNCEPLPGMSYSFEVEESFNGRLFIWKYCPQCAEELPQWVNKEKEEANRKGFFPCGCGAAADFDEIADKHICTNPICKMYMVGVC